MKSKISSIYKRHKGRQRTAIIGSVIIGGGMSMGLPLRAANPPASSTEPETITVSEPAANNSKRQAGEKQSVPVARTIVTQDVIKNNQIDDLPAAQKLVPSLQLKYNNEQNLTYNIRGFGNSSTSQLPGVYNGTNIYVDDVFLPRPGTWTTQIIGLSGVEVLKGPQGTTGGYDSVGGAVNILTAPPPTSPEAGFSASYGNYDYLQFKGNVGGPIGNSGKVFFNLSAYETDRSGILKDDNPHDPSGNLDDYHDRGVRSSLLIKATDDLTIRINFDFAHQQQSCCIFLYGGADTTYTDGTTIPNNVLQRAARIGYTLPAPGAELKNLTTDVTGSVSEGLESYGTSAKVDYVSSGGYIWSSLTALRGYDYHPEWHNNTTIAPDTNEQNNGIPQSRSIQQEWRVSLPPGQRLEATAGLFTYFEAFSDRGTSQYGSLGGIWYGPTSNPTAVNNAALNFAGSNTHALDDTFQAAPYVRGTYHITSDLALTAGLRYSYTTRWGYASGSTFGESLDGLTPMQQQVALALRATTFGSGVNSWRYNASQTSSLPSGTLSLSYDFTKEVMGYVTYSRGVRPGGLNASTSNIPAGASTTVKPETSNLFETGLKTSLFDHRLLANGALFWQTDNNYITTVNNITPAGVVTSYLANAPQALSRGAELDLRADPTPNLTVFGSATFDDAFFTSFPNAPCAFEVKGRNSCDFTGSPLSLVSKWVFAAGVDYKHDLGEVIRGWAGNKVGYIGGDQTYLSDFFSATNDSPYSLIKGYGITNLHAGIKAADDRWDLSFWVHNLFDRRYYTTLSNAGTIAGGAIVGYPGLPLMFGFTLSGKF